MLIAQSASYSCLNKVVYPFYRLFLAAGVIKQHVHSYIYNSVFAGFLIKSYGIGAVKAGIMYAGYAAAEKHIVCGLKCPHIFLFCVHYLVPHICAGSFLEKSCHLPVFVSYHLALCKVFGVYASCLQSFRIVYAHMQTGSCQLHRIVRRSLVKLGSCRMPALFELALIVARGFYPCAFWKPLRFFSDYPLY